jgi:DoxX-like family
MEHVLVSAAPAALSKKLIWTGRVLTGLLGAFLLLDGAMKLVPIAPVIEACNRLGYDPGIARTLGLLLVTCTVAHLIPRTQVLGALLLTAYLGGATATHVRVGDPCWFPVVMGVILWAGLYLREPRLRTLLASAS